MAPSLLLSQHPRTLVQIVGQALCGNETGAGSGSAGRGWHTSLVASLVNACSAAFINASSVPMKGVVCAVAVGRVQDRSSPLKPTLVLDPSEAELAALVGGGCFAYMFSSALSEAEPLEVGVPPSSLLWTNYAATSGAFDEEEFEQAQQLAEDGAVRVWRRLKESLHDNHTTSQPEGKDESIVDDEKMEI